MSIRRVTERRVAYLLPLNSIDSRWCWVCPDCGRRYQAWHFNELQPDVRLHRCPGELSTRWLMATRRRYRSK